jgi:hypothetical protein
MLELDKDKGLGWYTKNTTTASQDLTLVIETGCLYSKPLCFDHIPASLQLAEDRYKVPLKKTLQRDSSYGIGTDTTQTTSIYNLSGQVTLGAQLLETAWKTSRF